MKFKKTVCITAFILIGFIHQFVFAQSAPIRIQFQRGAISAEWRGNIYAMDYTSSRKNKSNEY